MSSVINFLNTAQSVLSDVLGAIGGGDGCTFTLSGGLYSVDFPVSPGSFEVGSTQNNQTVNIINLGDINMLGKRGLKTLKFRSFFPNNPYTFVQDYSASSPYEYVNRITAMKEGGSPCSISISGTDVSMPVSIDSFSYGEQDSTGDVYFSLSLKEYRYILPDSSKVNDTTGLKSRIANTVETKETTRMGKLVSDMETAQRVIQKTTAIVNQGERVIGLYKAMVKSGGVKPGTLITTTANAVMAGGKILYSFKEGK